MRPTPSPPPPPPPFPAALRRGFRCWGEEVGRGGEGKVGEAEGSGGEKGEMCEEIKKIHYFPRNKGSEFRFHHLNGYNV